MITVTNQEAIKLPNSMTGLFTGAEHHADVSFFWVDAPPGGGPEFHWHPYTETWVVLDGKVMVETQEEQRLAHPGEIVTVSPETVHRFRARGDLNLRMLCIHPSPKVIETFI